MNMPRVANTQGAQAPQGARSNENLSFCGKKVRIIIHKDGNKYAVDPVPVSVEGVQFRIKRGQEVTVPIEVARALKIANEIHYVQITHPEDKSVTMDKRVVPSYAYAELGAVTS
jgi:hypothetical protein